MDEQQCDELEGSRAVKTFFLIAFCFCALLRGQMLIFEKQTVPCSPASPVANAPMLYSKWDWCNETATDAWADFSDPFYWPTRTEAGDWNPPRFIAIYSLQPGTNVSYWSTNLPDWNRWHEFVQPDEGKPWLIAFPVYGLNYAFFFLTNETGAPPVRINYSSFQSFQTP